MGRKCRFQRLNAEKVKLVSCRFECPAESAHWRIHQTVFSFWWRKLRHPN